MPRTPQEIDQTAEQMKAAGAPDSDIRQFVELAVTELKTASRGATPALTSQTPSAGAEPKPSVPTGSGPSSSLTRIPIYSNPGAQIVAGVQRFLGNGQQSQPAIPQSPQQVQQQAMQTAAARAGGGQFVGAAPISQATAKQGAGIAADIGLETAGATGGQAAGAFGGPAAFLTVPAGGAIGAMGGNAVAQQRRIATGEQEKFHWSEMFGAGVGGLMPGGSLARGGIKTLAKEATKNVVGNTAAVATEKAIESGELPSGRELAIAAGAATIGTGLAKKLDGATNQHAARAAIRDAQNEGRKLTLQLGKELGYVVPPSSVRPNYANDLVSSVAGKSSIVQEVVQRNQPMTNLAVLRELELPETTSLKFNQDGQSPGLNAAKAYPFMVYGQVGAVSPQSKNILEAFKQHQSDANSLRASYRAAFPVKDPELLKKAEAAQLLADQEKVLLEAELKSAGKKDLIAEFDKARTKLAKIGLVEEAVNKGSGDVDASIIGKQWDDNPKRLTGELAKIGRFYNVFHDAVRDASFSPPSGVHNLMPYAGATMAAATQNPSILMAFLGAPRMAQNLALSAPYQNRMVNYPQASAPQDVAAMAARFAPQVAARNDVITQFRQPAPQMAPQLPLGR